MAGGEATTITGIEGTDDEALVRAAASGDRGALDRLLRLHYDRVFAICRRLTGNDADADDATQNALLAIVKGLDRYDGRASFRTWTYRVATNACLDELRRRSRRPTPDAMSDDRTARDRTDDRPSLDTTLADRLDLDAALAQLPLEFRAPVVLRDQLGLDYAEIAEVLALAPGTVRSRIARGRRRLADTLAGNQTPPGDRPNTRPT